MKIKGLIFDLDGVIVNTEINHFEAWKKTADTLGIPFTHKENERLKGLSRVDSLRAILALKNVIISEKEFNELMDEKNQFYLDSISKLDQSNLLHGVLNLLNMAKEKGIKLAIGSSSKNAPYIIDLLGLKHYFEIIVDGTMVTNPKPDPEVFLNAAKAMDLVPGECLVFEDAESGIRAANDGGIFSIGVGNPEIRDLAKDYINDLSEFNLQKYA